MVVLTIVLLISLWTVFGFLVFLGSGFFSTLTNLTSYLFWIVFGIMGMDAVFLGKTGKRQFEIIWVAIITLVAILVAFGLMYLGQVLAGWILATSFTTGLIALFVDGIRQKIQVLNTSVPLPKEDQEVE